MKEKKKLLYVDIPFATGVGGDMNRSRFIWKTLQPAYHTDLVLVRRPEDEDEEIARHQGDHQVTVLTGNRSSGLLRSEAIYHFSLNDLETYRNRLRETHYDFLMIRSGAPAELAYEAEKVSPLTKVIIDTDLVLSQYAKGLWQANRSLKTRCFLKESLVLRGYEKRLYRRPYLFLVANPQDQKFIEETYWKGSAPSRFGILPNAIAFKELPPAPTVERNILFFGALDTKPNIDAYIYLMDEVYPKIASKLESTGTKIFVAGRREQLLYKEYVAKHGAESHVRILGPVDDMLQTVQQSLFTVFPVLNSTGTRVRVLEAAKAKRTAVTTSLGAEGYEVGEDSLFIKDTPEEYAAAMIQLIDDPQLADRMGENLYNKTKALYGEEVVAQALVRDINEFQPASKRIAIVTNRFYPEVGGAETNIYFQARELAKNGCQVTVYTPKRIDTPSKEFRDGFAVRRLWNIFNPFNRFPYNLPRTFCPTLPLRLLAQRNDVVQSFPAIHYNATASLWCQRLLGKRFVLVSFDFRDYAGIIRETGKVVDMLAEHEASSREKHVLKNSDHVYAIANKEIDFIKRYTDKVSYSPVPILLNEYRQDLPSPREKYGLRDDEFVFLCLGRVSNVKGQDIALKAFDEALPQIGNAKLVIVGRYDYEPDFFREMRSYIKENGLDDQVLFTGSVEREEVLGWLTHSDIHVIPVRFMNSGAVVVESWAAHTPVIQSDVVDPNLVEDGENGYLFPSESISVLAQTMVRAYENREKFPKMAEMGNALVRERYTYDYLTKLYIGKYDELMASA